MCDCVVVCHFFGEVSLGKGQKSKISL